MLRCSHLKWIAVVCLTGGCATTPRSVAVGTIAGEELETRIRRIERQWRGTPYQTDGATKEGVDGANFVAQVFANGAGMTVPTVTMELLDQGSAVLQQDLRTGDLVFFQPPGLPRHVGIYLSRGEFAHASPTAGVTVSRMEENFWARAYWTARRIVADSNTTMTAPAGAQETRSRKKRIGW